MDILMLMHAAQPRGSLLVASRRVSSQQLASLAGLKLRETEKLIEELEQHHVFSRDDDGTIYSRRMRRDEAKARTDRENGKKGGNPHLTERRHNGGVNPPDKGPDNGGDKAKKLEARNQNSSLREPARAIDDEFKNQFWPKWPNKVAKPSAHTAFRKARQKFFLDVILDGIDGYIASKPSDRQWLNPATFLNQHRFLDTPAACGPSSSGSNTTPQRSPYMRIMRDGLGFGDDAAAPNRDTDAMEGTVRRLKVGSDDDDRDTTQNSDDECAS